MIGHIALEDTDSCSPAIVCSIFNGTGDGRSMRKACPFGQKTSDFDIRIRSFLRTTKKFQDELISENNGRITLFSAYRGDFKISDCRCGSVSEQARWSCDEFAGNTAQMPAPQDHIDKGCAKFLIEHPIVQDAFDGIFFQSHGHISQYGIW